MPGASMYIYSQTLLKLWLSRRRARNGPLLTSICQHTLVLWVLLSCLYSWPSAWAFAFGNVVARRPTAVHGGCLANVVPVPVAVGVRAKAPSLPDLTMRIATPQMMTTLATSMF